MRKISSKKSRWIYHRKDRPWLYINQGFFYFDMTNKQIIEETQKLANTNFRNIGFSYRSFTYSVYKPDHPIVEISVIGNKPIDDVVINGMDKIGFKINQIISVNFIIFKRK